MSIGVNTPDNMMLAAGATVSVGGVDVGAMVGETTLSIETERYFPDLFGSKGEVKQTGFITKVVPKIATTMAETSHFQLMVTMDQLGSSADAGSAYYGSGALGQMASGDYVEVIVSGAETCGGKSVSITLPYAYVSSSVNVTLADDAITTYEVEFTGTYDPADPDRLPVYVAIELPFPSDIPVAEGEALISIYNLTTGAAWTDNTNWMTNPLASTWYGVTVAGGHVTELNLLGNNLDGDISTWRVQDLPLTGANGLRLYSNASLTGDLSGWSLPAGLLTLYLYNTGLSGDIGGWSLPAGLEDLRLYDTSMEGDLSAWVLPATLEYLSIHSTSVEGDISGWVLPAAIETFNLTTTSVEGDISGWALPAALKYLYISGTDVEGDISAWTLPAGLQRLYIYDTSLEGTPDISGNTAMTDYRYQDCGLSQPNVDAILLSVYNRRMSFTFITPVMDVSGTNLAPSGIYQDGDPPTTGKEYAFELELDPDGNGHNLWDVTYT